MTIFELILVIACIVVLAAMLFPVLSPLNCPCQKVNCVSNLKQINLALRIWEGDNNDKYPMSVPKANGGAKEMIEAGNVAGCMQVISNELSTPKLLICPADHVHSCATTFDSPNFNNSHISYFFGVDVTNEDNPQMILDGDDNLTDGDSVFSSGVWKLPNNVTLAWGPGRHTTIQPRPHFWSRSRKIYGGNIGFADGSVQEVSTLQLQQAFQETGLATNRIAIP